MPAASLAAKVRENVLLETSASSASSSSVVASNPFSANSRSAASASARRVRSFLRSRSGRERSVGHGRASYSNSDQEPIESKNLLSLDNK